MIACICTVCVVVHVGILGQLVSAILPFHTYVSPKDPTMVARLTQETLSHTQSSHWPDTTVYTEIF